MNQKILYAFWGGMFAFCAALGFLPEPQGFVKGLLIACAVLFFLPPALLALQAWQKQQKQTLQLIRNLSAASLIGTLLMLVLNLLSVYGPQWLGSALHTVLVVLSAPMFCGQSWIISLILWASLMWSCIVLLGRMKKE